MSRLTDEELANLTHRFSGAIDSYDSVRSMIAELRDRRAADLTSEDVETLKYLRGCAMAETRRTRIPDRDRAFKLLDRLLARAVGR